MSIHIGGVGALVFAGALLAMVPLATTVGAADTRPEFVIAVLGDSYASGEGAPDVHGMHSLGGDLDAFECQFIHCFSETWWSPDAWFPGRLAVFPQGDDPGWQADARRCHRSTKAPGPAAAMELAAEFTAVRVTVLDFACGGSKTTEGLLVGWPGAQPPLYAPNLPSQVAALESYVADTGRKVDAIVMNIGGNDARFADLVTSCLILDLGLVINDCTLTPLMQEVNALLVDGSATDFRSPTAPLSARFRVLDAAFRNANRPSGVPALTTAIPKEIYLTGLPNPSHDAPPSGNPIANPQDFCDGTQTADLIYRRATLAESVALEFLVAGMNAAMQRAADRHGWVFLAELFDVARNHGVCADGASFFRTNMEALRIQGDDGIGTFLPEQSGFIISPGIAHPNEAGYAARAEVVARALREQMTLQFRAPQLTAVVDVPGTATLSWAAPVRRGPEIRWEVRITDGVSSPQTLRSDTATAEVGTTGTGTNREWWWLVRRHGQFTVRVRACRDSDTARYCGPFSNAITLATDVPDTPLSLHRDAVEPWNRDLVRIAWSAAANMPSTARYEIASGPWDLLPREGPSMPGGRRPVNAFCGLGIVGPAITSDTSTTATFDFTPGKYGFQVRACTAAGCSAYSPVLIVDHVGVLVGSPKNMVPSLPGGPSFTKP